MVNLRVERTLSMICVFQKKIPPVGKILLRCCWNSALKLTTFQSLRLICLKRVTRQCESLVWWKAFLKSFFQITKRVKTSSSLLGKLNKLLLLLLFSFVCLFFTDIDECALSGLSMAHQHLANICHKDANCTNTKGSYNCGCQEGYAGNGNNCEGRL